MVRMKSRNAQMDLLRVLAMLMIVFNHLVYHGVQHVPAASAGAMHGKYQCFLFPIGLLLCFLSRLTAGMGFSLMPRPKFRYYCNTCSANCGKKSEISSFPDGWLFRNSCAAFWKHSVRLPCHAAMLPHGRIYSFRFPFHRTNPNETKIPLYAAFQAAHSGI